MTPRRAVFLFAAVGIVMAGPVLLCDAGSDALCETWARSLQPGEHTEFDIRWMGFKKGVAVFDVSEPFDHEGVEALRVTMEGKSKKRSEHYESIVDRKSGKSLLYRQKSVSPSRTKTREIRFDYENGQLHITKTRTDKDPKTKTVPLRPGTRDMVSVLLNLRTVANTDTPPAPFLLHDGSSYYQIRFDPKGPAKLKVLGHSRKAYRFRTRVLPMDEDAEPDSDINGLEVWISDDPSKALIKLRLRKFFGSLVFNLTQYETP